MHAIVTGATKGIGLAITNMLASKDYDLGLCSRSAEDLNSLSQELKKKYPDIQILTLQTDVGVKSDLEKFVDHIRSSWDTVDVLVNNAGVYFPGEVLTEPEGTLETLLKVNLMSAYHLTRSLMPLILKSANGYIFNMCSVASIMAYPNGGSYSISKFALYGFSKVLREELKDKNVKVCSILPGGTWSDSWKGADLPESRLMQANDIAEVISSALAMSPSAVIEDIILRPQLGDL